MEQLLLPKIKTQKTTCKKKMKKGKIEKKVIATQDEQGHLLVQLVQMSCQNLDML
jgi:hypothetical protein